MNFYGSDDPNEHLYDPRYYNNQKQDPYDQNFYTSEYPQYYETGQQPIFGQQSTWVIKNAETFEKNLEYYQKEGYNDFEDELPLLQELGINFTSIFKRTLSVLNPLSKIPSNVVIDSDLAGPLIYFILFGVFLLLSGKLNGFGAIYGLTATSTLFMYVLMNLMNVPITFLCTLSVIGYALLPMVLASFLSCILNLGEISVFGFLFSFWSSFSAANMVSTINPNYNQYFLLLYPFIIIYGFYAAMIIFAY